MRLKHYALAALLALGFSGSALAEVIENPASISALLDRIGGSGTADRIEVVVDDSYGTTDAEKFLLTSKNGKPCVKATTLSAATTGIGWYLNHHANVNIAWNNLTTDLASVAFPLPADEEHTTSAKFRYYLNYCTFSYSMSTWTWERWQQEIDWMALHGINMPLQIVGLEEVWRKLLMEDYGYTKDEANAFVAGPCFMAWFAMNNLEGHGGPNPDWWYTRQAELGKNINERMKALGMDPVLPGFAGMVPTNFTSKTGIKANGQGSWSGGFTRPFLLTPASTEFTQVAEKYYEKLAQVMGTSKYYSMDPFHEGGGATGGVDAKVAYKSIYDALDTAVPDAGWILQQWQFAGGQWRVFDEGVVPKGKLIVLDLNSDAKPGNLNSYNGHETVYCTIFNFGGRTGFFGRFNGVLNDYFKYKASIPSITGIGAAPEAIEQTPVMYDLLFELPWYDTKPDGAKWMADYAKRRYSAESAEAAKAWELLRTSALDCTSSLQGPHEAIMCGEPALNIAKVSSWGGSEIFYDTNKTATAAYNLLYASLSGENYSYDLTDIVRQSITDYSKSLLGAIKEANDAGNTELFQLRRDAFLQLMLDVDELLNTNKDFMVGHWTERARAMADEAAGTTDADRDWLEHNNARTLITTWTDNYTGLRDYSYRQWGGTLKDLYYARWKQWFDNNMSGLNNFTVENNWAKNDTKRYPTTPTGSTRDVAAKLLSKYLSQLSSTVAGVEPVYVQRLMANSFSKKNFSDRANRGYAYTPTLACEGATIAKIEIDLDKNKTVEASETSTTGSFDIPADAAIGEYTVTLTLSDRTTISYPLLVFEEITEDRTVTVSSADEAQGTVSIDGVEGNTVTGKDFYVIRANGTALYDFDYWSDPEGNKITSDNPLTYYNAGDITLVAHFITNKWGVPATSFQDKNDIANYKQFVKSFSVTQNGETTELYSTDAMPDEQFFALPTHITAAPGAEFTFEWTDGGGLSWLFLTAYCDLNSDGTFDKNSSELLGTLGRHSQSGNTEVANGKFTVLLPYDTKVGTTHLRVRFDSPWWNQNGADNWNGNSTNGPVDPNTTVTRFCYEIILDVVDRAPYPTTVSVESSDLSLGNVRSENATCQYPANSQDDVILTPLPEDKGVFVKYVDNHGRDLPAEWVDDNNIARFKPFDNAVITAVYEPEGIDGWVFESTSTPSGLNAITGIKTVGEPTLDLTKANGYYTEIKPGLFAGKELVNVTLPDELKTNAYAASIKGAGSGVSNTLPAALSYGEPFVLTVKGHSDGSAFNQWGSGLLASGTNALAQNYSGGFQLYLAAAGTITAKWNSNAENKLTDVNLTNKDFTLTIANDGTNAVLTVSDGTTSQSKTFASGAAMGSLTALSSSIPAGIDLTAIEIWTPVKDYGAIFAGSKTLRNIHVSDANAFAVEKNGVAYAKDATDKVIAYPEGRLYNGLLHLTPATAKARARVAAVAADQTTDTVAAPADFAALYSMSEAGVLANANTAAAIDGTAALTYTETEPQLTVGTAAYDFAPVTALANNAGTGIITFPANVIVPEGAEVYIVTAVNADGAVISPVEAGTVIPRGTAVLTKSEATFDITTQTASALEGNLLVGTLADTESTGDYTVADGSKFSETTGTVAANTGYLPASVSSETEFPIVEVTNPYEGKVYILRHVNSGFYLDATTTGFGDQTHTNASLAKKASATHFEIIQNPDDASQYQLKISGTETYFSYGSPQHWNTVVNSATGNYFIFVADETNPEYIHLEKLNPRNAGEAYTACDAVAERTALYCNKTKGDDTRWEIIEFVPERTVFLTDLSEDQAYLIRDARTGLYLNTEAEAHGTLSATGTIHYLQQKDDASNQWLIRIANPGGKPFGWGTPNHWNTTTGSSDEIYWALEENNTVIDAVNPNLNTFFFVRETGKIAGTDSTAEGSEIFSNKGEDLACQWEFIPVFDPGVWYRISNAHWQNGYMLVGDDTKLWTNEQEAAALVNANTLFRFEPVGDNRYHLTAQGVYVGGITQSQSPQLVTEESQRGVFALEQPNDTDRYALVDVNSSTASHPAIHQSQSGSGALVGWTKDAGASQWKLHFARNLAVNTTGGYGMGYFPFPVKLASDGEIWYVYEGFDQNSGTPVVSYDLGSVVPALTPFMVKADGASTVALEIAYGETPDVVERNILAGSMRAMTATADDYCFGTNANGEFGFFKVDPIATNDVFAPSLAVAKNGIYVPAANVTANPEDGFLFNAPDATGIVEVTVSHRNAGLYDLQGRRVGSNPAHGIYITSDGHKVRL